MLRGDIGVIVVAHKDRLCRFAFDFVEQLANHSDCKIIVANQTQLSPESELCNDLMSIVHCFSCRLYGLRSYSKNLKKELKESINNPAKYELGCKSKEIQC